MTNENKAAGKWGYTHDDESYYGMYDTAEEAADAGADGLEGIQTITVGQFRAPEVLGYITPHDAELLLERITEQEDYCGDWADGALEASREELADLTARLQEAVRGWLDQHDLWPTFGVVQAYREIDVANIPKGRALTEPPTDH